MTDPKANKVGTQEEPGEEKSDSEDGATGGPNIGAENEPVNYLFPEEPANGPITRRQSKGVKALVDMNAEELLETAQEKETEIARLKKAKVGAADLKAKLGKEKDKWESEKA